MIYNLLMYDGAMIKKHSLQKLLSPINLSVVCNTNRYCIQHNFHFMKYIVIFLITLITFTACKKEKAATLYMSGYLYNNCYDSTPIANHPIRLYRTDIGVSNGPGTGIVGRDTTDVNGYFKIYFPPEHHANWMILQGAGGGDFMERIPPTQNHENIPVFANAFANLKIKLNIVNQHPAGDTLVLRNLNNLSQPLKIPYPITNGEVYSVANYVGLNAMGLEKTPLVMNWGFIPSSGFLPDTTFSITKFCGEVNEFTINVR